MIPIRIGQEIATQIPVFLNSLLLSVHLWIIGQTGSGKTETIKTILTQRMLENDPTPAMFILDPLGGLSNDLLNFFAHPTLCTDDIRDRLLYVEPARGGDNIITMNPLAYRNSDDLFFNTGRAVDVILRGSAAQDLSTQPRLRQWMFNSFLSTGAMNYPPAMAEFLLRPGTEQHRQMLRQIPERLRLIWAEVLGSGGSMKMQLLESTRNRTAPFFDCPILRLMFSRQQATFNVEELIRERKIVLFNMAPGGVITPDIASTIGGLLVNDILETARNLPPEIVKSTILCMDEFQNYVGNDLLEAIPEVRQRGIELILAHQSLSQLKRGDIDLTSIIQQCRNKILFCNSGEDADLMAHELASLDFDPMKLKEELKSFRQKKVGQHKEWLRSTTKTETHSEATDESAGSGNSSTWSSTRPKDGEGGSDQSGESTSESRGRSHKEAHSSGTSETMSESFVDDLEDFYEVSSRQYFSFQEQFQDWARDVRHLKTGQMVCKFKDDSKLYHVIGEMLEIPETPALLKLKEELLEKNFQQKYFISREQAENDLERMIEDLRMGRTPLIIEGEKIERPKIDEDADEDGESDQHIFR